MPSTAPPPATSLLKERAASRYGNPAPPEKIGARRIVKEYR